MWSIFFSFFKINFTGFYEFYDMMYIWCKNVLTFFVLNPHFDLFIYLMCDSYEDQAKFVKYWEHLFNGSIYC